MLRVKSNTLLAILMDLPTISFFFLIYHKSCNTLSKANTEAVIKDMCKFGKGGSWVLINFPIKKHAM